MKRGAVAAVLGLALALAAGTACARDGHRGPRHGRWGLPMISIAEVKGVLGFAARKREAAAAKAKGGASSAPTGASLPIAASKERS